MTVLADHVAAAPPRVVTSLAPEDRALWMRLAMAMAILSVAVHKMLDTYANYDLERYHLVAATLAVWVSVGLVMAERTSRIGVALFAGAILLYVSEKWAGYHNHGWLSVWAIPVAALFGMRWWDEETYAWYLRMTLGVVMLGACAQKLVAGTYLDGTFIAYLSLHGSETERLFGFLCGDALVEGPCTAHRALGVFLMGWQAVVGALLLAGVRSLWFLGIEIAFLMGAGLYADEMNFQVLNIALFCLAFRYGMPPWLAAVCVAFLALDVVKLSVILGHVL
ncbi:MAG: hypothetical protein AAFR44_02850 [Pseudomonadota bacterium]